jgi:hypothetical protein
VQINVVQACEGESCRAAEEIHPDRMRGC